jgi:hypothetical protein
MKKTDHFENLGAHGENITVRLKEDGKVRSGIFWVRTGTNGGLL